VVSGVLLSPHVIYGYLFYAWAGVAATFCVALGFERH
jgi:hypothetical protein